MTSVNREITWFRFPLAKSTAKRGPKTKAADGTYGGLFA